ncbi:hypothetical protein BGZ67_007312 [Mortierella alpina]|nr:hypothetical protein BGZ67_007312 [Mortierella alpina]
MQTSLPFWVIGLFFSAFKILLVGAFGGILSIYAASGSRYGNSIRWSRQGGYLEMICVLRNSVRPVPRSAAIAMTVAIIASTLALFSSVFFSTMVHRSDIKDNQSYISTKTMRPMATGQEIDDWLVYLGDNSNVEDSLGSLLNDTRNIPDAILGRRYTPRTFGYEVACNSTDVVVGTNASEWIRQEVGGCSAAMFDIGNSNFVWEPKKALNMRTAPDQFTIVAAVTYPEPEGLILREHHAILYFHFTKGCVVPLSIVVAQSMRDFVSFPDSGMTSLPRTILTRCQYPSGALNVGAQTQMRFAIQSLAEYDNITKTIIDDSKQLPLLATMSAFTKNGTFLNPQSNSTLVALTKAGVNVHFLSCHSVRYSESASVGLLCDYQVIMTVMTTPQLDDPIIAADLKDLRVVAMDGSINQNVIVVGHLPLSLTSAIPTFSISSMLNATLSGAQYFASLGQNFVMDWEKGQLYVLFDTVDIKDGQEFSTGLFVTLVVIMVLCAGVWAYSEKAIAGMYTGSLYKLVHTELEPHMEKTAPMLMSCTNDPLAFEGVPIVCVDEVSEESSLQELASATKSSRLSS